MTWKRKVAAASAVTLAPVALWAPPAAAAEKIVQERERVFVVTSDGELAGDCTLYVQSTYDPDTRVITVSGYEEGTNPFCRDANNDIRLYVDYIDASGERRRVHARTASTQLTLEATGVVSNPVVTAERAYADCKSDVVFYGPRGETYTSDCLAEFTFSAAPK